MAHYLDPKNDLTFKRVFGEHKHLCRSLLNSLLPLDKPVVSLEYQTGELVPELEVLRHSIVDVRCTDADGRQFIVEMQMHWSESFKSRVLLNASKAYVLQLDSADRYELLQPVYSLNFVNDTFERSPDMRSEYYHHYRIVNVKHTEKQIKGLEFVFIELPKFRPQNRAERRLHELWLRFLTEINERTGEAPAALLENSDTREAVKYMEVGAYTKEQLSAYDKVRDGILTERSLLSDALKEGEAQGRVEGEAKGRAEGKAERSKEVALNLLKLGISLEDIMQSTGLTKEEIQALQKK
ncbi:MAG: Rpn family recombination-promoting nuclease/putative transposase [Prevotellaceae bacterium]|jgi:predicted transposase/invertase (TIGR01784 family)|nr:Rpn family recombination-promoting nuclease/putative transposase [Prevotellaceae bacterium]